MPNFFQNSSAGKILFFCLLLSICFCPSSYAQTTLKIGVYDNKPIIFVNDEGEVQGLFVDLVEEIAIKENWHLEYVIGDFSDVFAQLKGGGIDILPALAYSKHRKEIIDYASETILSNWAEIYVPGDKKLTSLLELEGKKVGVIQDDIHFTALKELTDRFNISCRFIEVFEYETLFEMLQANFVHAGVVNRFYGNRHNEEYSVEQTPVIFNPIEMRFGATKDKHQDILTKIDSYMLSYLADGNSIYYQLRNRWFADDTKKVFPLWFFYSFITVAGATLLFFGAALLFRRQVQRRTEELTNANLLLESQILERKEAQKALLENEEKYRNLLESTSTAPWELDLDSLKFTYMGHQVEKMLGYSAKSWTDFNTWAERVHPEDREPAVQFCEIETKKGRNHDFIYRATHKDGSYRWIRDVVSVVMDSGTSQRLVGFMQDITEQKNMEYEQKQMEVKLQQAQKLEAIGTLAGGIAHDFNNILSVILGYTEMARENSHSGSVIAKDLDMVLEASNRAKSLVQQILTFSRQEQTKYVLFQPAQIIKEAIKMLRPTLPSTITISQDVDMSAGPVFADAAQFNQILINLCTNAFHAMEKTGGKLDICLKETYLESENMFDKPDLSPGKYVQLSVRDSGPGISEKVKDKIFDPFFTTKDAGKGTGMGLSIIHGIIKSFGGSLTFDSEFNKGSIFHVFIPVTEKEQVSEKDRVAPISTGKENILFVDDEEIIAEMSKVMLERLGYNVTVRTSSIKAFETFNNHHEQFDLIITDQTMPGMTGADLARRMLQIRPDIPVILCTGFSSIISKEDAEMIGIKGFAYKPLSQRDIAGLIRKVLGDESAK